MICNLPGATRTLLYVASPTCRRLPASTRLSMLFLALLYVTPRNCWVSGVVYTNSANGLFAKRSDNAEVRVCANCSCQSRGQGIDLKGPLDCFVPADLDRLTR